MKISAHFGRTQGLPGFSSLRADCTVECEISTTTDPGKVLAKIDELYRLATLAVETHLREQVSIERSGGVDLPEPDQAGPYDQFPDPDPEPEPEPPPRRVVRVDPSASSDLPTNGRSFLGWLRKFEDAGGPDLKSITKWGKATGAPWKVTEWEPETIQAAVAYVRGCVRRAQTAEVPARR